MYLSRLLQSAVFFLLAVQAVAQSQPPAAGTPGVIDVKSRASLIHLGSLDSFDTTDGGKQAASLALTFIEKGDRLAARQAIEIYNRIIPDENFGGEYTALRWVLECQLANEQVRENTFLADPLVKSFHSKLAEDDWKPLRGYLTDKYHLREMPTERIEMIEIKRRNRFLEDFILFANPVREQWEQSSKMIAAVGLKPGDKVADIGSGPGFFSFAFGKLVGEQGKVYAVDNNEDHIGYLKDTIDRLKIKNVESVMPKIEDMGVPEKVDVVFMCSLYHNIYTMFSDTEREAMVGNMLAVLKPGGRLVMADNGPVEGRLPYHGPYIARELIIEQFRQYGFDLVETHQFIPQRYMLTFRPRAERPKLDPKELLQMPPALPQGGLIARSLTELPPTRNVAEFVDGSTNQIRVLSRRSLIHSHVPGIAHTFSTKGRAVAEIMFEAINTKDPKKLAEADKAYDAIIPKERIGDDYTALQWFCRYLLAPEAERAKFITSPLVKDYFDFFAADDFRRLKLYLKNKYVIGELKQKFEELAAKQEELDAKELAELKKTDTAEAREKLAKRPPQVTEVDGKKEVRPPPSRSSQSPQKEGQAESAKTGADGKPAPVGGSTSTVGADTAKSAASTDAQPGPPLPRPPTDGSAPKEQEGLEPPPPPYQALPLDVEVDELISWWEYMNFCNPRREEWEKTTQMLDFLDIKPGTRIADVGSGGGYFTMKFAERVGPKGMVFALDLSQSQLDNLKRGATKAGFTNVDPILSREDNTTLPENSIDMAFLCSLYHAVYVHSMEYVKDNFIHSLKRSLKPGGRLIIADNEPISDHAGGYYGPHIAKELIIAQLAQYGFKFESFAQFVPHRYILVFAVEK